MTERSPGQSLHREEETYMIVLFTLSDVILEMHLLNAAPGP